MNNQMINNKNSLKIILSKVFKMSLEIEIKIMMNRIKIKMIKNNNILIKKNRIKMKKNKK